MLDGQWLVNVLSMRVNAQIGTLVSIKVLLFIHTSVVFEWVIWVVGAWPDRQATVRKSVYSSIHGLAHVHDCLLTYLLDEIA